MKRKNRWLALFLTAALSVSIVGCGSDDSSKSTTVAGTQASTANAETTEAEKQVEPLSAAKENMASVTSMDAQLVMEMNMNLKQGEQEQSLNTTTMMDVVAFTDPMRLKMEISVDAGEQQGTTSQSIYIDTSDDGISTLYMFDGANWLSQQVSTLELGEYDILADAESYVDDSLAYQASGTEQVDGKEAYKYTAVIKGDELKEALLSSGALDSLAFLGLDESQLGSMMDDLGEMTMTLWIDKETLYPVKYEMDMTKPMDTLMSNVLEAMGEQAAGLSFGYSKMVMTMTYFNFNAATDFSVPEEALGN